MDIYSNSFKNELESLINQFCPLPRSISGPGVEDSIKLIEEYNKIKFYINEYKTGQKVNDWNVPKSWRLIKAYLRDPKGRVICDSNESILRVVQYSESVHMKIDKEDLLKHIYISDKLDNTYPYVTSYYASNWGFCLTKLERESLEDGVYEVFIESEFNDTSLKVYEYIIEGKLREEILLTSYVCHPCMYNNEASGPLAIAALIKVLKNKENLKYTYRFILGPETIGAISYLSNHLDDLRENNKSAFNLSCVGRGTAMSIIEPQDVNCLAFRAAKSISDIHPENVIRPYEERGSDERQYNYPTVNIPMVTICRDMFGYYDEYHTAADKYKTEYLEDLISSIDFVLSIIKLLEINEIYECTTIGEPQLGKRGLYRNISTVNSGLNASLILNILNSLNAKNDCIELVRKYNIMPNQLKQIIDTLLSKELIKPVHQEPC